MTTIEGDDMPTISTTSAFGQYVAAKALRVVPCECDDFYYDRKLVAPECRHHDLADELSDVVVCECTPCVRLR